MQPYTQAVAAVEVKLCCDKELDVVFAVFGGPAVGPVVQSGIPVVIVFGEVEPVISKNDLRKKDRQNSDVSQWFFTPVRMVLQTAPGDECG